MAGQPTLEGIVKVDPAIEGAAKHYVLVRDKRMVLTKDEVAARDALVAEMKRAGIEFYKTSDGLECQLTVTEKVKVSGAKGEGDGE